MCRSGKQGKLLSREALHQVREKERPWSVEQSGKKTETSINMTQGEKKEGTLHLAKPETNRAEVRKKKKKKQRARKDFRLVKEKRGKTNAVAGGKKGGDRARLGTPGPKTLPSTLGQRHSPGGEKDRLWSERILGKKDAKGALGGEEIPISRKLKVVLPFGGSRPLPRSQGKKKKTKQRDEKENAPYLGNEKKGAFPPFENPAPLRKKGNHTRRKGCRFSLPKSRGRPPQLLNETQGFRSGGKGRFPSRQPLMSFLRGKETHVSRQIIMKEREGAPLPGELVKRDAIKGGFL